MADNLGNTSRSVSEIKSEVREIKNLLSEMNYNSEIEKANDGMHQMIGTLGTVASLVDTGVKAYNAYKKAAAGAAGAQALLNTTMSAGTFGLVAAGVAAAVIGISGLIAATNEEISAEQKRYAELEMTNEALRKQQEESRKAREEREKTASADIAQIEYVGKLREELSALADEKGIVLEKDKARASFILNELNSALGTEYTMTGNMISQYQGLQGEIDNLIERKKLQILQEAALPAYEKAVKNQSNETIAMAEAGLESEKLRDEIAELSKKRREELVANVGNERANSNSKIKKELDEKRKLLSEYEEKYKTHSANVKQYNEDITTWETAQTLNLEGNVDKAIATLSIKNSALDEELETVKGNKTEEERIIGEAYAKSLEQLAFYESQYRKGVEGYTQDGLEIMQQNAESMKTKAESVGINLVDGIITGINGFKQNVKTTIDTLAANIPEWAKSILGIQSPSRVMRDEVGAMISQGMAIGIQKGATNVLKATTELSQNTLKSVKDGLGIDSDSRSSQAIGIGKAIAQGVAQGIEKEESEVEKVFEELAETTAKSAFERKLQFAQSTEEIMKIKQQEVNGLLDSEKEYLAEKRRIELEQEEEEYREKLENAKDEEARQKIRYEREKELQKREQEAYLEILKEGADAEKKILDGVTKELEKKKDRFIDGLEEIKDAQESFYNSLDSGGFLETVTTTLGDEEYDVEGLRDWELENKALKNYSELLDKVSERLKEGFGEDTQGYDEFMDELRKNHKGDGGKFLAYLDMADDGELLRYIEGYQENKALREGISKDSFSEEQAQLIEEFTRDWGTVPEEFFDIGEESAKEYVQGFKNKMHELVDMAREEIESSFELSFILPQVAMLFSGLGASSNVVNYNSTYNVASAEGESTRKQIEAIRNAEIYDKMSKGYRV